MTSHQLLQQLHLTAAVHSDALEVMLGTMQHALDTEQQQEAAIAQLEAQCSEAHEALDRITAMANVLTASPAPSRAYPINTSSPPPSSQLSGRGDAMAFAKLASSFSLGTDGGSVSNASSSPSRHANAASSVTAAEAHLASLRHQLAVAEHNSVRRRLQRIEGLKLRINKALEEFIALYPLIDARDARRGQAEVLAQVYGPSNGPLTSSHAGGGSALSPSHSSLFFPTRFVGGGEGMDAVMREALLGVRSLLMNGMRAVHGLLRIADPHHLPDEDDEGLLEDGDGEGLLEALRGDAWLQELVGGNATKLLLAHGDDADADANSSSDDHYVPLMAAFEANVLAHKLSDNWQDPHYQHSSSKALCCSTAMGWLAGLEQVVGDSDAIADHYGHLSACWDSRNAANSGGGAAALTAANPAEGFVLSPNPSIPLPPDCPLQTILDPPRSLLRHSGANGDADGGGVSVIATPTPNLPPSRHILHERFSFKDPNELKRLEGMRIDIIRDYVERLGRGAEAELRGGGREQCQEAHGGTAEDAEDEEDGAASLQEAVSRARFEGSRAKGFRVWPAVSRPLPREDDIDGDAEEGIEEGVPSFLDASV